MESPVFVMPITRAVLQFLPRCLMRAPYGLNIIDNCLACPVREEHLFCNLPLPAVQRLNEIKSTATYPRSAMLFIEGQQPRGVFVLCTGKVKLSTSSSEGKTIITKISEPGDVLGLNATISSRPYEVTGKQISSPAKHYSNFCESTEKSHCESQNSSAETITQLTKRFARWV